MDEAKKTNLLRGAAFGSRYFTGRVIDVGCGDDLVVPHAVPFDTVHGDAQWILNYFEPNSFDCVHSSHCLEHMRDVDIAITQWWGLVKPGGYLIIVVPDEDLYEQGTWPSLFNPDHKATFRLGKPASWSSVSYDLGDLARALPDADLIEAQLQDDGYDRSLMRERIGRMGRLLHRFGLQRQESLAALMRRGVPVYRLNSALDKIGTWLGKPVDQTLGPALAQIQVIVRKRPESPLD